MLKSDDRQALIDYRMEKSAKSLHEAEETAKLGFWSLTAQRLYYAAYYAVTAKLLERHVAAKSHAGVISMLNLHFVRNGTLPLELARVYAKLFAMRQSGDYDDYFDHTEEDVRPYISMTRELIEAVKKQ